jgi:hypothetical protein
MEQWYETDESTTQNEVIREVLLNSSYGKVLTYHEYYGIVMEEREDNDYDH